MIPIFIFSFWIITFGASFLEKILRFTQTNQWLSEYLQKTPFKFFLKEILFFVIFLEFLSVIFCSIGLASFLLGKGVFWGEVGIAIGISTLISFLIGQRFAQDYQGARGMTLYIFCGIISLYIL